MPVAFLGVLSLVTVLASAQIALIALGAGVGTVGTTGFTLPASAPTHKTVLKIVTVDASGQTTNTVQTRTVSGGANLLLP